MRVFVSLNVTRIRIRCISKVWMFFQPYIWRFHICFPYHVSSKLNILAEGIVQFVAVTAIGWAKNYWKIYIWVELCKQTLLYRHFCGQGTPNSAMLHPYSRTASS